ncbi:MAG: ATP-binding protein [Calothrix sp. MO_167.B12]|nr:ATP-binding protein [Calothrix sp. MO_167.B12]
MSGLGNYINECARLLYWIYFKPYTLKQWLQDIHPDLKPNDNPYLQLKQFPNNKPLRRYAGQVFWLTAITPQLAVLLVGFIYVVTEKSFAWLPSEMFLTGWIIGLVISRFGYVVFGKKLYFIFLGIFIVFMVATQFLENVALSVLGVSFGVACGVAFGVILGVAFGVAFGVVFGISFSVSFGVGASVVSGVVYGVVCGAALGIASSVVFGAALGAALGVVLSVALAVVSKIVLSVALAVVLGVASSVASSVESSVLVRAGSGVAFGVALGVALGNVSYVIHDVGFGVAFGVGFGVAFVLGVLRVYFWLPELLWVGWLFLFTRQGRFSSRLRYLPPYFDQLIHLPLPLMDTILVKAYRENPTTARETIDYLTTSTNQQQVAATAIVNIVLDTLERCRTFRDIIAITEELAWIPTPSPPEIGTVLPQFLDISRSVQSADMATSVYRKAEILKNPINSLNQMLKSFAFIKNPRVATASSTITQRWLNILETARRNLQEQSRYAQEIPQVYIAGNALDPETAQNRFKGRQDLFREIENIALMSPPPTLLLYGGRRTGKTSTLQYLPQKVGGDLIPLRVDVQGIADAITLPGVAKSLVKQIIDSARISRNLTLPHPNQEELKTEPFPTLRNWFTTIERTAPGKRFLLCLDEFERLEEVIDATKSRAPLNFLRHVIQHRSAWTLLFSGSHTLDEMETYWSDYLISTRYVRLTYLEKPEAEELIIHPVPDFPDIYLPETVERIIYWTRCQPYLVQLLCSELVDYLNREHPQNALNIKANPQDVDRIIPKALISGSPYFDELWKNTLNQQQRECIRNFVEKATPTEENPKVWTKLIQKEILEHNNSDGVRFQVPLIERSIIQKIEEEP